MAESDTARNLRLEYRFDRFFEEKLAQVFQALAPKVSGLILGRERMIRYSEAQVRLTVM